MATTKQKTAARRNLAKARDARSAQAKGAGMICPNMATMLAFITTDAAVDAGELRRDAPWSAWLPHPDKE